MSVRYRRTRSSSSRSTRSLATGGSFVPSRAGPVVDWAMSPVRGGGWPHDTDAVKTANLERGVRTEPTSRSRDPCERPRIVRCDRVALRRRPSTRRGDRFPVTGRSMRRVEGDHPVPNPLLNEKKLEADRAGWAAPTAPSPGGAVWAPPAPRCTDRPHRRRSGDPVALRRDDRPRARSPPRPCSSCCCWSAPPPDGSPPRRPRQGQIPVPGAGDRSASSSASSPSSPCTSSRDWAKILGPIYALAQGFFLGSISKVFNEQMGRHRRPGGRSPRSPCSP